MLKKKYEVTSFQNGLSSLSTFFVFFFSSANKNKRYQLIKNIPRTCTIHSFIQRVFPWGPTVCPHFPTHLPRVGATWVKVFQTEWLFFWPKMFLPCPDLQDVRDEGLKIMEMLWSPVSPSPAPTDQGYQGLCVSCALQKETNKANLWQAVVAILEMRLLKFKGAEKFLANSSELILGTGSNITCNFHAEAHATSACGNTPQLQDGAGLPPRGLGTR